MTADKKPIEKKEQKKSMTIDELAAFLRDKEVNWPDDQTIRILPNGEIVTEAGVPTGIKPVTFKENLGGEYGIAA